jgi:hypothetical protein
MNSIVKQYYNETNDIWGYPQKYKGIELYPLTLKDSKYIDLFYQLLLYPKNYIPDRQVIKMSYLKFLLSVIQSNIDPEKKNIDLSRNLIDFLKFITKKENIKYAYSINEDIEEPLMAINIKIIIDEVELMEMDFDNLREIILEQNGMWIEYIEDYNPGLEEKLRFINRSSNGINFKDELFVYASLMNIPMKQLEDITLYQFKNQLERLIMIMDYELIKPLEISGQIKSKDGSEIVKHYFTHSIRNGRYSSIMISENAFFKNSGIDKPNNLSE